MVKNMKRNEIKNENSDNLAAMGIGAMIVFIALILVAAVASAVIIQTAEKLQQNAQSTGDQAQDQMASKVMPLSIVIQNGNTLRMTFELAPGSESITAQDVAYSVVCNAGTDAGDLQGSNPVSANAGATLLPGQIYEVSLAVGTCQTSTPNVNHYLTLAAGNAGFTYEVLSYGADTNAGTVVV
jgi:flagellin FlaB